MHIWQNKSIIKSHKMTDVKAIMANRPKDQTDEEWNAYIKEEKINKLILLDKLLKVSQKAFRKNNKE
jgi:GTP-binding protein EngB required for normal cell division